MKTVYLSGPMTGIEDFNHPAFNDAANVLRAAGYSVINPAEINTDTSKSWEQCIRADLRELCECESICLLPGWEKSSGAHLELHMAHRMGMDVLFYAEMFVPQNEDHSHDD